MDSPATSSSATPTPPSNPIQSDIGGLFSDTSKEQPQENTNTTSSVSSTPLSLDDLGEKAKKETKDETASSIIKLDNTTKSVIIKILTGEGGSGATKIEISIE